MTRRERRLQPELMDQPGLDVATHETALRALSRINACSLSHRILWPAIRDLAHRRPSDVLRILDVACGGGDVALRLTRAARQAGVNIQIDGCDLSETAVTLAQRRAKQAGSDCHFFRFDALRDSWPRGYDVVCCSLFLHHLPYESASLFLRNAASAAQKMVLVSDLVRNQWGYLLARVFSRLLTRSPIVHFDGPASVAGAFTPGELQDLAAHAGLESASIVRRWPARMLLKWERRLTESDGSAAVNRFSAAVNSSQSQDPP